MERNTTIQAGRANSSLSDGINGTDIWMDSTSNRTLTSIYGNTSSTRSSGPSFCENWGEKVNKSVDCNLPNGECDQLRTLKYAVLAVNIACVLVTLVLLILRHRYSFFNQRICCQILLTNLLSSFAFISYDRKHDGKFDGKSWCIVQGFFIQTFDISMFMWIGALTVFLYLALVKGRNTELHERRYAAACWIIPIPIAFLPVITGAYGPCTAPYCWLMEENCGVLWRFAIYWVPVFGGIFVVFVIFIYMYCYTTRSIRRMSGEEERRHKMLVKDYLKPLIIYAASFVLTHFVQILNRIHQTDNEPHFALIATHVFFHCSYGVVLSTLFILFNGYREFLPSKLTIGIKQWRIILRRQLSRCGPPEQRPPRHGVWTTFLQPTNGLATSPWLSSGRKTGDGQSNSEYITAPEPSSDSSESTMSENPSEEETTSAESSTEGLEVCSGNSEQCQTIQTVEVEREKGSMEGAMCQCQQESCSTCPSCVSELQVEGFNKLDTDVSAEKISTRLSAEGQEVMGDVPEFTRDCGDGCSMPSLAIGELSVEPIPKCVPDQDSCSIGSDNSEEFSLCLDMPLN